MTSDRPLKPSDKGDDDLNNRLMAEVNQARKEGDRTDRSRDISNVADLDLRTDAEKKARAEELMAIFNRPGNEDIAKTLAANLKTDDMLRKQLYS